MTPSKIRYQVEAAREEAGLPPLGPEWEFNISRFRDGWGVTIRKDKMPWIFFEKDDYQTAASRAKEIVSALSAIAKLPEIADANERKNTVGLA
jgi:hypothetical protein